MVATYTKQALLTGAGAIFLDFMETEDAPNTAPTYAGAVMETPSLETVNAQLELSENRVFLSNILHSDLSAVQSATIPVTAGYFPRGFAEEAQGMVKVGGGWAMPTNPKKKPFRMAIPFTDENGDELIVNFPKCTLAPVNIEGSTSGQDVTPQMKTFNVTGLPLVYKADDGNNFVFYQLDMADEENKTTYDRDKLLENGWFDETSLTANEKTETP